VKARVRSLLKAKAYADAIKAAQERDLAIAREIQMGILPSDLASPTQGTGLEVDATIEPARHVGGDLFEVLRVGDDRLVVAVGDVCGKGIPASLFMAVTVTLLRMLARELQTPQAILTRLNDELAAQNPRGMFVTMVCAVFDLRSGLVTCANGGHNSPLLMGPAALPRMVFPASGPVLGLFPGGSYTDETMHLATGETLLLYSDGVTEANDPQGQLFDDTRLQECFAGDLPRSAAETVARLLAAVRTFAAGAAQSDDITILAVRRNGGQP
jgi:sigma-B regulation protein RsbU (phosphoserine phosphatase)